MHYFKILSIKMIKAGKNEKNKKKGPVFQISSNNIKDNCQAQLVCKKHK